MNEPTKPALKIADTPTAEEEALQADALDREKKSTRPRTGRVRKLSPQEIDLEIARINLANGIPTLASGTESDHDDEA